MLPRDRRQPLTRSRVDLRGRAKLTEITTSARGLSKENNGDYYRSRKCFYLKSPTVSTDTDTETGVKIM